MVAVVFLVTVAANLMFARDERAAPLELFVLATADGASVGLADDAPSHLFTVLAFLSRHGVASQPLQSRLEPLVRAFAPRRVRFLAIDSDSDSDSAGPSSEPSRTGDAPGFPRLLDPLQVVADRLGVPAAGEVLLLDRDLRLLARGGDLDASLLEAAFLGAPITLPPLPAGGPRWQRATVAIGAAALTFWHDAAPILFRHCVECHRPGDIGPMALLDPDEAKGWAPTIVEVTRTGRMPPWHADPRFGSFLNARRLTETEKETLARWAAAGAPAGDRATGPALPPSANSGWAIGTPDLVVELPAPQSVPAEGVVPYRYVPVDPKLTSDCLVEAIEVLPGNRAVTHHVGVFLLPPDLQQRVLNPDLLFAGSAPGGRPVELPPGYAKRVAKGTRFLFQLHYTPNGSATTDLTRMALRFARGAVTHEVANWTIANPNVVLPPRSSDVRFTRTFTIDAKALITGLMPHMHWRGQSFRFELERTDGSRQTLLDVPRFDFGWQHTYQLREPLAVEAGDRLHLFAGYDNSAANPRNPDPKQLVRVGEQTFEEMMVGYVDYVRLAK
ncbi:MAG: hypothetical protein EXS13_08845 [Planctomycetes bacterium]|nr:hypothetical protein [Planctomycetota bacterium]